MTVRNVKTVWFGEKKKRFRLINSPEPLSVTEEDALMVAKRRRKKLTGSGQLSELFCVSMKEQATLWRKSSGKISLCDFIDSFMVWTKQGDRVITSVSDLPISVELISQGSSSFRTPSSLNLLLQFDNDSIDGMSSLFFTDKYRRKVSISSFMEGFRVISVGWDQEGVEICVKNDREIEEEVLKIPQKYSLTNTIHSILTQLFRSDNPEPVIDESTSTRLNELLENSIMMGLNITDAGEDYGYQWKCYDKTDILNQNSTFWDQLRDGSHRIVIWNEFMTPRSGIEKHRRVVFFGKIPYDKEDSTLYYGDRDVVRYVEHLHDLATHEETVTVYCANDPTPNVPGSTISKRNTDPMVTEEELVQFRVGRKL